LYSRDTELDVQPSPSTNPPPMAQIIEQARAEITTDPKTKAMMIQVGTQATIAAETAAQQSTLGGPQTLLDANGKQPVLPPAPVPPEIQGEMAAQAWLQATIKNAAKQIMAPFRQRVSDSKQIGQTIEIVVSKQWGKAKLKKRMEPNVRSGLTCGIGWIKGTWQERSGNDPIAGNRDQDAQDAIAKLKVQQDALEAGDSPDPDALRASVEQKITGLEANVQIESAKGFAVDFVRAEDITLPNAVSDLSMYLDSPWIGHRIFIPVDDVLAACPDLTADDLTKAANYWPVKVRDPKDQLDVGAIDVVEIDAEEADQFRTDKTNSKVEKDATPHVCLHEVWSKENNSVLAIIEGIDEKYARKPAPPNVGTTRFYSFFQLAFVWEDGERHPASLIDRSRSLLDEVSRLYSNRAVHRRRTIPRTVFDKGGLSPDDASAIATAVTQEMIGIEPTMPGTPVASLVQVLQYAKIDEALYNDEDTVKKIERVFGVQEALASSINVAKTATEAEIQQTGTNARTSHKRDAIDAMLSDLAQYTTEIVIQKMTHDDVVQVAGPFAMWPQGIDVQHLDLLVNITIKAGSSGKPDTSAQQQSWATVFPLLKQSIIDIGRLRQSDPSDISDCYEELLEETVNRTGEHLDVSRFIPPAPSQDPGAMPPPPGAVPPPGQPGASPGNGAAPMPSQQTPPVNNDVLPVPHNGHVLNTDGHIVPPPGAQH
jgi:hypothetical protein